MAKQQTGKVPPRKTNTKAGSRPGAPPRPPRKPPKRRRGGSSRTKYYAGGGAAAVIAVVVILIVVLASGGGGKKGTAAVNWSYDGTKVYGGIGPEGVPIEVGPNLAAANVSLTSAGVDGIACDAGMSVNYHIHAHLAMFIHGKPVSVPLAIGFPPSAQVSQTAQGDFAQGDSKCLYWLHTHAQDGIIHIESPSPKTYRLGQFFDIWHQPLSSNQVGPDTGPVTATVGGKPYSGDPSQILLTSHEQIVLNVGTPIVTPPPISFSGTGL